MKKYIESNVTLTFLIFFILGFIIPYVDQLSTWSVVILLAIVIFFACFKIDFKEIKKICVSSFILFYMTRFIIFPAALYYCISPFIPDQALAVFLFALLPPATASPAISVIFNGNIALSFALLVIGSLLTPFMLPMITKLVIGTSAQIDIQHILVTLTLSILIPISCFIMLRKQKKLSQWIKKDGSFISLILIGLTLTIAIAKRKAEILLSPTILIMPFIVSSFTILLFYVFGWLCAYKSNMKDKVAYSLSSDVNNIGIGVSIALLYFPPDVSLFLIIAEIPWVLSFAPFRAWVNYRYRTQST